MPWSHSLPLAEYRPPIRSTDRTEGGKPMQTADARRINDLRRELASERAARLQAEQRAAGLRSANLKLQALVMKRRADELAAGRCVPRVAPLRCSAAPENAGAARNRSARPGLPRWS